MDSSRAVKANETTSVPHRTARTSTLKNVTHADDGAQEPASTTDADAIDNKSVGIQNFKRAQTWSSATDDGASDYRSDFSGVKRIGTSFTSFSDEKKFHDNGAINEYQEKEERWGYLTSYMKREIVKPKRTDEGKLFTLKDVGRYIIKQARIRRILSEFLKGPEDSQVNRCSQCNGMDLAVEKFLVKDRVASLKDTRLFDQPYRRKSGLGIFEVGSGSRSYPLGTLNHIWKKSVWCSCCRLVVQSLTEQPKGEWIDVDALPSTQRFPDHKESLDATCFATWQIDGRELDWDESPSLKTRSTQARTRRIRLQWKGYDFEDSYLVLVASPSLGTNDFFLGRRVPRKVVNIDLMKNWVSSCCEHHGERCGTKRDYRFELMVKRSYFGVIDVKEMRLTRLPCTGLEDKEIPSYVALSYTWGKEEPRFKTMLSNIRESQKSLLPVLQLLPQTIRDAIELVRSMDERYVWVDSICIVQDSAKSWDLNASSMDLVYGNAKFTICAADGSSAEAGLHGMSDLKRKFPQHIEEYGREVRLMVSYPVEAYIERSTWNSRAWTFQERLLSRRCLIFTDSRVFFQCRSITMREDIVAEEKRGWSVEHANAPLQILDYLASKPILLYTNSVKMYTSRELTKPENILAAFQGIGNLVGKHLGSNLLFGLPRSHFDWALLWEPLSRPFERQCLEFPSWSWCGWKDVTIEYKQQTTLMRTTPNLNEWLSKHTWITWHVRDGYGSIKLVWDKRRTTSNYYESSKEWGGYDRDRAGDTNPYGRAVLAEAALALPTDHNMEFHKTIPEYPFGVHVGDIGDDPAFHFSDQKYLQFWTWSAIFRISEHLSSAKVQSPGSGLKRFGIMDYKHDWCGTIVLDEERATKDFPVGKECEFIAISEAYGFSEDEYQGWMYYISKDREQSEWDLYYVLLIEIRDEIAYRVGLGKVYKEAFENSCRQDKQWKEFILG